MKSRILNMLGYTAAEILIVTSIVAVVPLNVYIEAYKSAQGMSCLSNLRNIFVGVQMYEIDNGRIPDIVFYPKNFDSDPKSIFNVLRYYVEDTKVYVCPVMPDELKKKKITYIWNDNYNGKPMHFVDDRRSKWIMTEMTAVQPEIPPPHKGAYNVLFLDGHAESVKEAVYLYPTPADLIKDHGCEYAERAD
ncbi:MAG: hypothetical protein JW800_07570 [Candidatus Omnitrophica bacterium]|nr:hypothetical protein [Candidatus Omnitrophota bacterium]